MTLNTTTRQPLAPPPVTDTGGDMGMVALVAMLTACSSEDVLLDEPNAKNEITFNVTTNRASRAVAVFNDASKVKYFRFSAWEYMGSDAGQEYALADLVKLNEDGTTPYWENTNGLRYWPGNGESLNFYAWCCGGADNTGAEHAAFNWGNNEQQEPQLDFTVANTAEAQTDLIYAVALGENREAKETVPASQVVNLNFKHALSQVVFTAENKSNKIHVEIDEIGFGNIEKSGTFSFPVLKNQSGSWSNETVSGDGNDVMTKFGTEGDGYTQIDIKYNTTVSLTSSSDQEANAFMLLPQKITSTITPNDGTSWLPKEGAYIKVKCRIWNIAEPKTEENSDGDFPWSNYGWNEETDNLIFGSKDSNKPQYEELRIPISIDWTQGTRYTYHIIFGTGNAGYTTKGEPAIIPMTYHLEVAPWVEMTPNPEAEEPANDVK